MSDEGKYLIMSVMDTRRYDKEVDMSEFSQETKAEVLKKLYEDLERNKIDIERSNEDSFYDFEYIADVLKEDIEFLKKHM